MDFSQQYFANAQPYQYMGIAPLTPSHSNSAASDDFNTTSPPDVYAHEFPSDQFNGAGFDAYGAASFNPHAHQQQQQQQQQQPPPQPQPQPPSQQQHGQNHHHQQQQQQPLFPGPPTPPNNKINNPQVQTLQHHRDPSKNGINGAIQDGQAMDLEPQLQDAMSHKQELSGGDSVRGGAVSDDEDLTPAQSRRKAQNRAAQRAFRERKEKHVKDLEAKLASLEAEAKQRTSEHERLKRELQKMSTENEILRATSHPNGNGQANGFNGQHGNSHSPETSTTGPMHYNPTDFYSDLLEGHNNKSPSHRVAHAPDGERLLAAGATWDFIVDHPLFKRGLVDVGTVSDLLKDKAQCDGQGPVFGERTVMEAIEASVASGSDELL